VPISPCGRVVDLLRSCYSTRMRFGTDPLQSTKITWYFCEDGAENLGIPTPFNSRNYAEKGTWPELGEVEGARRDWADGSFPIPVPGTSGPCGDPAVWEFGYQGTIPPLFPTNDFGLLPCCNTVAARFGEPCFGLMVDPTAPVTDVTKIFAQLDPGFDMTAQVTVQLSTPWVYSVPSVPPPPVVIYRYDWPVVKPTPPEWQPGLAIFGRVVEWAEFT
jgi:hypothetical protein